MPEICPKADDLFLEREIVLTLYRVCKLRLVLLPLQVPSNTCPLCLDSKSNLALSDFMQLCPR